MKPRSRTSRSAPTTCAASTTSITVPRPATRLDPMTPFLALIRRQLTESRWLLGLTSFALFALSWLTVLITSLTEDRMRKSLGDARGLRGFAFRGVSGPREDLASVAFEVLWWNHPFILI